VVSARTCSEKPCSPQSRITTCECALRDLDITCSSSDCIFMLQLRLLAMDGRTWRESRTKGRVLNLFRGQESSHVLQAIDI